MKFGVYYWLQVHKPYDKDTYDPDAEHRVLKEMMEQVELADKLGFDYLFCVEHHFLEEYSHMSAPEVVLAAASQRTKNMRLGFGIVHMAPGHNHPARTAERIATLDLISDGRVEFGTGEGANQIEFGGFGTDRRFKKPMWEEATRECLRMMTTEPYPGFEGEYFQMPVRNVVPKPLQKPHPPVWVAVGRRESLLLAARYGMGSLGHGFETPEEARERVSRYYELIREECRPIGAAINPAVAILGNMMCARTDEEAIDKGLRGAQYFSYALGRGQPPNPPRKFGQENLWREFIDSRQNATATAEPEQEPEEESQRALYRAGMRGGLMGSPEFCRATLRAFEESHIDAMLCQVQCGDRRHEDVMASLELFGKEVMPEFKERHEKVHKPWREQQLAGVKHLINSSI